MNSERDSAPSVALYWDFENLHAGLAEAKFGEGHYAKADVRFKPQEPLADVQAVIGLGATFGPIAINRAYCNWQFYGRYRDALLHGAVELVQLFPPGAQAKNGADIRLCLDAMEDITRFGHIGTVVIVGGDSDFMPLAQKIKATGRTLVGVGTRRNTNRHWARSCHAFHYYDDFVDEPDAAAAPADPAADTVRRALRLLAQTRSDAWAPLAALAQLLKRMDASLEPREHAHADLAAMLLALGVELRAAQAGDEVRVR